MRVPLPTVAASAVWTVRGQAAEITAHGERKCIMFCGNNNGGGCLWIIIIIILLFCCGGCGGNSYGNGCGNALGGGNCGCGC
ncbi:MAG: hypothetical protein E7442_03485 [Ruminococcaceae bacterium]|nr:hypothetical protein [Oscillospiraceae bacterium]